MGESPSLEAACKISGSGRPGVRAERRGGAGECLAWWRELTGRLSLCFLFLRLLAQALAVAFGDCSDFLVSLC